MAAARCELCSFTGLMSDAVNVCRSRSRTKEEILAQPFAHKPTVGRLLLCAEHTEMHSASCAAIKNGYAEIVSLADEAAEIERRNQADQAKRGA